MNLVQYFLQRNKACHNNVFCLYVSLQVICSLCNTEQDVSFCIRLVLWRCLLVKYVMYLDKQPALPLLAM